MVKGGVLHPLRVLMPVYILQYCIMEATSMPNLGVLYYCSLALKVSMQKWVLYFYQNWNDMGKLGPSVTIGLHIPFYINLQQAK